MPVSMNETAGVKIYTPQLFPPYLYQVRENGLWASLNTHVPTSLQYKGKVFPLLPWATSSSYKVKS